MYFIKPNHCTIVTDEGPDVYGTTSGEIAPHGICALWEPNKEEIHSSSSSAGKSDESTTNVSATFSCEICNAAFNSREELKQHTIKEHTGNTSEGYNK
jgi:Zinc-finger of C2H2 type